MTQNNLKHKRSHYFVKKAFQLSIILKFCLIVLSGAAVSTGLLLLFSQDTLTSTFRGSHLEIQTTARVILPAIIYTNLITLVLITIATIIVTLFISHKLAGPLFRFEKEIREISEGKLSKDIRLRANDQIVPIADNLNLMRQSLRGKIAGIRDDLGEISRMATDGEANAVLVREIDRLRLKMDSEFTL